MTLSISDTVKKHLGWCPNSRGLQAHKRTVPFMADPNAGSTGDSPAGGLMGWIGDHGQAAVAITASVCLIALTAVLKNVLHVPAAELNRDIILYIIMYLGFIMSFVPVKDQANPEMPGRLPLIWCAVVVIATLAIIAVYTF